MPENIVLTHPIDGQAFKTHRHSLEQVASLLRSTRELNGPAGGKQSRRQPSPVERPMDLNRPFHDDLESQQRRIGMLEGLLQATGTAIMLLDSKLAVRFITPSCDHIIPSAGADLGRRPSDLLTELPGLATDMESVIAGGDPLERDFTSDGRALHCTLRPWPELADRGGCGVLAIFRDMTADRAGFIAGVSHDLRQPLQTLILLQGLLARAVKGQKGRALVGQLGETVTGMSRLFEKRAPGLAIAGRPAATEEIAGAEGRMGEIGTDLSDGKNRHMPEALIEGACRTGTILVVEDDAPICELTATYLVQEGHQVLAATDGPSALELVASADRKPDLLLVDYALSGGMTGLDLANELRSRLGRDLPTVILTADTSPALAARIAKWNCRHVAKPAGLQSLTRLAGSLLAGTTATSASPRDCNSFPPETSSPDDRPVLAVIDPTGTLPGEASALIPGHAVDAYRSLAEFLAAYRPGCATCLLAADGYLAGRSIEQLQQSGSSLPVVALIGDGDVPAALAAVRAGATEVIERSRMAVDFPVMISRLDNGACGGLRNKVALRMARLTPRQTVIMRLVLAGHPSKNIAADLGISQRTVENHRAAIMRKTGARSLPALARLALAADWNEEPV